MTDTVSEARAKARKGDTQAMMQLADWYYFGADGLDQSHIKSFEWLLKAAECGHAGAQNGIGARYELGDGVAKDPQKALEWYDKAIVGGDADACFNLGLVFEDGVLIAKDDEIAGKLYEEGAARGSVICQHRLGYKYLRGNGVRQDIPRALELLEFAGQSGYGSAYETLGMLNLEGELVPRNPERAYDYFSYALAHFDSDVMVATGNAPVLYALCLLTGMGCPKDRKGATEVLEKAAEAGNGVAEQVVRERIVRDPLIYTLFSPEYCEKRPVGGWDISTLLLSKFA